MRAPKLREGFTGQEMHVIPRPTLAQARRHPLLGPLCPTDVGWYPRARYHFRERPSGAPEHHLMLCINGQGTVEVSGNAHTLRAGQILVIPSHRRHRYWADDRAPWSIYWMHFEGADASHFLENLPGPGVPVAIDAVAQRSAVDLFRQCLGILDGGYSMPNLICAAQTARHLLAVLLVQLPSRAASARPANENRLEKTLEYMLNHLDRPLRLQDLAEHAGCSASHLLDWFRAQTGESPMAHLTHLRIRTACRLLHTTGLQIKSIAASCGYPDPFHFSRVFTKVMGLSPRNYRLTYKD